jgi:hypothetical protein
MMESNKTGAKTPAEAALLEAAQASDATAETCSTASDELSEDHLEAVAGGARRPGFRGDCIG